MDWTDEQWRAYRNYADRVVIEIRFLDEADRHELDTGWIVVSEGANWDQDWLLRGVEALGTVPESGEPRYFLETRESRTSWGADAASFQIVLTVGEMVLGAAIAEGIRTIAKEMAARLSDRHSGEPLGEDEAVERSRWIVWVSYEIESEHLTLLSVEVVPPNEARVSLRGHNGETFEVELRRENGVVLVAKIKRTLPPHDDE